MVNDVKREVISAQQVNCKGKLITLSLLRKSFGGMCEYFFLSTVVNKCFPKVFQKQQCNIIFQLP